MRDLIDHVSGAGDDAGAFQADEPGPGRKDVGLLVACQQLAGFLVLDEHQRDRSGPCVVVQTAQPPPGKGGGYDDALNSKPEHPVGAAQSLRVVNMDCWGS